MKQDIVNILIGDSIAYGLGDNECFGWYNRLRKKNTEMLKQFYFNLSIPGQSSCEILERFEIELKNRVNNTDLFNILFAFGIKDALKLKKDKQYIKVFENNVIKLINIAKKYTDRIYFLGLLDVDVIIRTEYNQESISQINELLKLICEKNNAGFISMADVVSKNDLFDGLHPNEVGHDKISNYIYNYVFNIKNF